MKKIPDEIPEYKSLSTMDEAAFWIAVNAHFDQKRADGKPYITHPIAVAESVRYQNCSRLMCISLLHDVLEDTDTTIEKLRSVFSKDIVNSVIILTKLPSESYFDFIMRIKNSEDNNAIIVKIADLTHNINDNGKDTKHLKDKYRLAKYILENIDEGT